MNPKRKAVWTATACFIMAALFIGFREIGMAAIFIVLGGFAVVPIVEGRDTHINHSEEQI